ncbi:hypothetical protein [Paenibacillus caui]|uniref:hypothetical protein n=1 Tax=Paenibacillus caui TaxID=2873927 RepID=UPI001CA96975|nr:hypothetical protein [Paenibacillus caui]
MGSIVWITAAVVVIMIIEVPPLLNNGMKKELWVFGILLLLAAGLSIAEGLQLGIPNPLDGIAVIFKPFRDLLFGLLK